MWVDNSSPPPREVAFCELCGARCEADPDVWDTAGFDICTACLEGLLNASTDLARAEVGMVGGGH